MTTYVVVETVEYRIEADSAEDAIEHVIQCGERDSHCFSGVYGREAYDEEHCAWGDEGPIMLAGAEYARDES